MLLTVGPHDWEVAGYVADDPVYHASSSEYEYTDILLNLGIEDVNIAGRPSSGYTIGSLYLGGLVGCNNEGSITNCYSSGTVTGDWHVGGLVAANGGSVTNCYATGAVTGGGNIGRE